MYYQYDYSTYIQYILQCIEAQQSRIDYLETAVEKLEDELANLRNNSAGRPERIEYKFDQLKVERLEGTLNIGITPTGGIEPNSIEDFTIKNNNVQTPEIEENHPQLYENIINIVYDYLNKDCYSVMKTLEKHYNYELDIPYRNFIVEDIRKQIDHRIKYYLKDVKVSELNDEALKNIETTTINYLKNDINRTMEEFIKHLPQKGE